MAEFVRAVSVPSSRSPQKAVTMRWRARGAAATPGIIFYTRLVNDLAIYGIGTRPRRRGRTLQRLERLLGRLPRLSRRPSRAPWSRRQGPEAPRAQCR